MTEINKIRKALGNLSNNDIAKAFGYKDGGSYCRSHRKKHIDNGIKFIYEKTLETMNNDTRTDKK